MPQLLLAAAASLASCSMFGFGKKGTPDNEPTLKTLAGRQVEVEKDRTIVVTEAQAIDAYRKFLDIAPKASQRSEAMRRIGDLEMDLADNRSATGSEAPDYKAAIARYNDFLKAYPNDPGNDRVLYQLARAHEQGGDLNTALATLDRLVKDYPLNRFRDEAQFRRGELLFTAKDYPNAEKAFATVLAGGPTVPYHDRSLYMQGWSQFKQAPARGCLRSFFAVLDLKIAGRKGEGGIETLAGLSRADRELVEDTFRVTSISLANLKGAESIPEFIGDSAARQSYEFRVYEQLGELYIRQERTKDAADTFGMFARVRPLHAQAPVLQARVIEIYEKAGFANLALEAKKEYVARYGVASEFRRANPEGWDKAQPLVKTHLAELARHYHASAQKSKASADYQEAVHWYREYLVSFPTDPTAPQNNFLLAELLFEDARFAEAAVEYEKTAYGYPAHAKSADAGYAALLAYAQRRRRRPRPDCRRCSASVASACASPPQPTDRAPARCFPTRPKLCAKDGAQAAEVARVIDLQPPAADGAPGRLDRARPHLVRGQLRRRKNAPSPDCPSATPRATTWSSARPRRSTSRASRRSLPGRRAMPSATLRASPRSRRSRASASTRSTTRRRR
jgi:TolA-binding protein